MITKGAVGLYDGMEQDGTLLIIDMQPGYAASRWQPCIDAILEQIANYKQARSNILVVEFLPFECGRTLEVIVDALHDYKYAHIVNKYFNDGSNDILHACQRANCPTHHFTVCGVNSGICVRETVFGLHNIPELEDTTFRVIAKGCFGGTHLSHDLSWAKNKYPRITLDEGIILSSDLRKAESFPEPEAMSSRTVELAGKMA